MPTRTSPTGSELFIVDNSDEDWKVLRYLHDWCQIAKSLDIATGYFEIGSLLALKDEWQKLDSIRILMGDEVSMRTQAVFRAGLTTIQNVLNESIEEEKLKNDFLAGVPAIVAALKSGKIQCRVYRKDKFHAKAYITHGRLEVVGSSALVGSSNFTYPGLTENLELNVQITGRPVSVLQEWYDQHWNNAEDVTPEILRVIERHTQEYTPFEVYAKALHELLRGHQMTANEWEAAGTEHGSRVYAKLDSYQKDGYHEMLEIAKRYKGAFLCDGVGLGKTFVGLMLIERLIQFERKRVLLLVPKSGRKSVWERTIKQYLPHIGGGDFSSLAILNHTDLQRAGDFPERIARIKSMADVVLIDEAHNFRNPGTRGTPIAPGGPAIPIPASETTKPSRYWQLYDLLENKQVFLLTATPVNNRLIDLQHLIELFSRRQPDYFKDAPLGIHSLAGHFRIMEKELDRRVATAGNGRAAPVETNEAEAELVLSTDSLFKALVVQRSRSYVRRSQEQQPGGPVAIFPTREKPQVAAYSLKKTYQNVLELLERAFSKDKPLFSLAIYYPLNFYTGPETEDRKWEEGRQKQVVGLIRSQFLKRFESSVHAFDNSCQKLLLKLLAWVTKHTQTDSEKRILARWRAQHEDLLGYVSTRQHELFPAEDAEDDEDIITDEMLDEVEELPRHLYKVNEMLDESYLDMNQIAEFVRELKKFKPTNDDKLKALVKLLKSDPVLKKHKVLLFTEYKDTARYLQSQLAAQGIDGVDEIDSTSDRDRGSVITQFAPYYNGSTSAELAANKLSESRILIATDVLSEGLNLQDATRLINYDIHWNPVRLMQRIGRVDRRLNPQIETAIKADHPDQTDIRGTVAYWNFLPPDELDDLLRLYSVVAHKTLRISKTFGIEGKQLLTPEDDYEALKDFTRAYEGATTPLEEMHLEYQKLLADHPDLAARLNTFPGKIFSGKAHTIPNAQAVFFCYALPAPPVRDMQTGQPALWSEDDGETRWYLYEIPTSKITETAHDIIAFIRSTPETPRRTQLPKETLADIRGKMEKHIKNTYLKSVQAPVGIRPVLKAWMELN